MKNGCRVLTAIVSVSIVICIFGLRDGVCGSESPLGVALRSFSGIRRGVASTSVSFDSVGALSSSGEAGVTSCSSPLSSSIAVNRGWVTGESFKSGAPLASKGVPNDEVESSKFTLSSNKKLPLKFIVRSAGPGVFQKECSCCSSRGGAGDGDAGFRGRNREELEFGKGTFFAVNAAFYLVDEKTTEASGSPDAPAGATQLSELAGPQFYPPLPVSAAVGSSPVRSFL